MLEIIPIKSAKRVEIMDITPEVQNIVKRSKVREGICLVYSPHTTTAVTINESADPSVKKDILNSLDRIIPTSNGYSHSEGNSDAHIKSSVIGCERTVIIHEGVLLLGTWQGIFFCEFDGPRVRRPHVKIMEG
ncbi:MAG: secondary thiamine-phosphate synthase enzyme YjbQ [bacterium]|nr:secondary thiamine-phosphate synthase enzyme YjbQ [bacterium]